MEILAMTLSDTFRKAVISIYLQTFVVLLQQRTRIFAALRQSFRARTTYRKYEKNTNKKKNTKILERNTKQKTMKAKEIIIKHVF